MDNHNSSPMTQNATQLASQLMACPSVTPALGEVFDVLEGMLVPLGFCVHRFVTGHAPDGPVENLHAIRGDKASRHFAFAGHVDVVPPGEGWTSDAFTPDIRGGLLYGRGAVDMKGSIAAFVAAIADIDESEGCISLIITGDEEGPAIFGTRALIDYMQKQDVVPDICVVGEPTSVNHLGDMVKIGRRGSVNMWISVDGQQGHVAYPHLADNPISKMVAILAEIEAVELDKGTDWFQPSNIEITDLHVGNPTHNIIPARAEARISIRFNDCHTGAELGEMISAIAQRHGGTVKPIISGEAFLTPPGELSSLVSDAIRAETGREPELSTSGGTSDARFLSHICPVVEFGLRNATMHKLDEAVDIDELDCLVKIYHRIVKNYFSQ